MTMTHRNGTPEVGLFHTGYVNYEGGQSVVVAARLGRTAAPDQLALALAGLNEVCSPTMVYTAKSWSGGAAHAEFRSPEAVAEKLRRMGAVVVEHPEIPQAKVATLLGPDALDSIVPTERQTVVVRDVQLPGADAFVAG